VEVKGVQAMNTQNARELAAKVAQLIEQASVFQALYGKGYRMKPGSPDEAWTLHNTIFNQQTDIARLLDDDALQNPTRRTHLWWKQQDTIDSGIATMIAQEVSQLIASCAYFEAKPMGESSHMVRCAQTVIAGMLHPSTLLVAQSEREQQLAS
jgi:hypothetical protein